MPVDVDAEVLSNARLSAEYCVIALRAPELAAAIRPGQFVMIRATHGDTPLLRRPYSIFDLLRDAAGAPIGFTILNKRVGVGSRLLYDAVPGARFCCLGPLGGPFSLVSPPVEAWMVAGGVGLAPFATLTEALAAGRSLPDRRPAARCAESRRRGRGPRHVVALRRRRQGRRRRHGYVRRFGTGKEAFRTLRLHRGERRGSRRRSPLIFALEPTGFQE